MCRGIFIWRGVYACIYKFMHMSVDVGEHVAIYVPICLCVYMYGFI